MTHNEHVQLHQAIEEAAELGDRFPDLPNYEVIEIINDICNTNYNYDPVHIEIPTMTVLNAYEAADIDAGYKTFATWSGIDIKPKGVKN